MVAPGDEVLAPGHGGWTAQAFGSQWRPSGGCKGHQGAIEGSAAVQAVDSGSSGTDTSQLSIGKGAHCLLWRGFFLYLVHGWGTTGDGGALLSIDSKHSGVEGQGQTLVGICSSFCFLAFRLKPRCRVLEDLLDVLQN